MMRAYIRDRYGTAEAGHGLLAGTRAGTDMPQGYRSDVYAKAYAKTQADHLTRRGDQPGCGRRPSTRPDQSAAQPRPVPQYKEREARNVRDDKLRAEVLKTLGAAFGAQGPGGGPAAAPTCPATSPRCRSSRSPATRTRGWRRPSAASARPRRAGPRATWPRPAPPSKAGPTRGRRSPGRFNAQAAGMAAEQAAGVTALRNQARPGLRRGGAEAPQPAGHKNRYEARSAPDQERRRADGRRRPAQPVHGPAAGGGRDRLQPVPQQPDAGHDRPGPGPLRPPRRGRPAPHRLGPGGPVWAAPAQHLRQPRGLLLGARPGQERHVRRRRHGHVPAGAASRRGC